MFKTDTASLEKVSFLLDDVDLANLKRTIEYLQQQELLTIDSSEATRVLKGLAEIATLKMEGTVYGFHVYDSWADETSERGSGVELYLRQGDRLESLLLTHESAYDAEDAANFAVKQNISTIYTGDIPYGQGFLGLQYETEDGDDYRKLEELQSHYEIPSFEDKGITVVVLDSLV